MKLLQLKYAFNIPDELNCMKSYYEQFKSIYIEKKIMIINLESYYFIYILFNILPIFKNRLLLLFLLVNGSCMCFL